MQIDLVISLISFLIYLIVLSFVRYDLHKIVLIVPMMIGVLSISTGILDTGKHMYVFYSVILGVIAVEIIKIIAEKILFHHLKLKSPEQKKEYIDSNMKKSLFDMLFNQDECINKPVEKSDSEIFLDDVESRLNKRRERRLKKNRKINSKSK